MKQNSKQSEVFRVLGGVSTETSWYSGFHGSSQDSRHLVRLNETWTADQSTMAALLSVDLHFCFAL